MGRKFENFVRTDFFQFLLPFGFEKIGKWWHKGEETDIVAVNGKRKQIAF